jgi:predicted ribosome quality control (RQC) complex YloA/Tae2 family protein
MGSIELDISKSVHENAAEYYERAKELRKKAESARKAIAETKKEFEKEGKRTVAPRSVRIKREKKWYERFHWFETDGFMVLAGRDAKQNEELVAKHLGEEDLFFHADIHGAPATILKNGKKAPEKLLGQVAQFAGSYSSAWKAGLKTVDVYSVEKSQVSKEAQGEYLGKGSFVISGKRTWFRNMELGLVLGIDENGVLTCVPGSSESKVAKSFVIKQGEKEKGETARAIAKDLGVSVDDVLSLLPAGNFSYLKR